MTTSPPPDPSISPMKRKRHGGESEGIDKRTRVINAPPPPEVQEHKLAVVNKILRETFRYTHLRTYQQEAILSVLDGKNTLVVLPTAAGKSLCFQIPALAFGLLDDPSSGRREHCGVTVVISPLLALIKDQVDDLKKKGVPVGALDSTQTAEEYAATCTELKEGRLRMLYCVPEKLNTKRFVRRLKRAPGGVRLVAVDEAHCVSEWGHSFRPDYLKVARFVRHVEAERVICLTATATTAVADGVCEAFGIEQESVFRSMPPRNNLWLQVEHTAKYADSLSRVIQFAQENPGPTIVYALMVWQVDDITTRLKQAGHQAEAFYAKLPLQTKRRVQDGFMDGSIRIICCTIAFGLGINKADIRNVIQIGLPRSIEEYSQQIGRAGRDDLPAKCALYVSPDDYIRRKNLEHRHFPSRDAIRRLVHDIFHVRCRGVEAGGILTVNQHDQVKKTAGRLDAWTAEYVYAALELRFGLMHQLSRREVPGQLRDDAISHLEQHGSNAKFRIRVPPLDVDVVRTADEIYAEMANRRNERIWRAAQIMQLVSGKRCVTRALAEHFDEVVVPGTTICRSCSVCVTAERRQERGRVAVAPPVIQGFDEREVASCSQMVARDEAAWGFSQVPVAEAESESEDEPDSCSTG